MICCDTNIWTVSGQELYQKTVAIGLVQAIQND